MADIRVSLWLNGMPQDLHGCVGNDDEQRKAPAPGDPDFRWHASIPERATLDYIKCVLSTACSSTLAVHCCCSLHCMPNLRRCAVPNLRRCAVLCCAVLCCAALCCAVLCFAVLCYSPAEIAWLNETICHLTAWPCANPCAAFTNPQSHGG